MFKFLSVLAVLVLTACSSSESVPATTTDSTAVTIVGDSVKVDSTVTDSTAK